MDIIDIVYLIFVKGDNNMNEKTIVLALGGNALQKNTEDISAKTQLEMAKKTANTIVDLIEIGYKIAIVHGNGPQVGQIFSTYEQVTNVPTMPFPECGAMSQGYIGYHLQQAIGEEMKNRNIQKNVVSIITQVVVDKDDMAFSNPTKPIGSFFPEEKAKELEMTKGYIMKEDSGRGFRRVVPSPKPIDIVEGSTIKYLVDTDHIVIGAGGGGVPVTVDDNGVLKGIAAVIDKDLAAEKLSEILSADVFIILTAVEKVYLNFNKPNEKSLDIMTSEEGEKFIEEGHFAPGSMLPKIQAALKFVRYNPNGKVIITSIDKAKEAIEGKTGTIVIN